jgi:predicted TIM-barrel fold metal-dependent hydrolase
MKKHIFLAIFLFIASYSFPQFKTKYPEIPRIDVHTHNSSVVYVENNLKVRDALLQKYNANVAFWINLENVEEHINSTVSKFVEKHINSTDSFFIASDGRMLCAFSDYKPHYGLNHAPEYFEKKKSEGFIGYKFWFGPYYRVLKNGEIGIKDIDDPRLDSVFSNAEKSGVTMLSLHIADPNGPYGNRLDCIQDPVFFWRQIRSFENVLIKHPKLKVIAAHCLWLICQDAQIDYLRYMLNQYPNLYIDLAATFQYFYLDNTENLRDFMIKYSDRILYGTDSGGIKSDEVENIALRYSKTFRILETDDLVNGAFWGKDRAIKGLNLPKEVLENIYYKNALRLYPNLKSSFHP